MLFYEEKVHDVDDRPRITDLNSECGGPELVSGRVVAKHTKNFRKTK